MGSDVFSIVELQDRHELLFSQCLEDREPEAVESGELRRCWIAEMKHRGLRARIAVDDKDSPIGMIQYAPGSQTLLAGGAGCYYIFCIWVPRYADDRGNHQGHGIGSALLAAAEEDARALGASGMAAWGLVVPIWMRAAWFRRKGYRRVDRSGIAGLMWKPFVPGAEPPKFVRPAKKPGSTPGQVTVTSFTSGWCRAANVVHCRAVRAAKDAGDRVVFTTIDTSDLQVAREWGMLDALFIDDREVQTGPPPSYEKIAKLIERKVRRL